MRDTPTEARMDNGKDHATAALTEEEIARERRKEYCKNWRRQRKMLEANAIRLTEEEFIDLLGVRNSIAASVSEMVEFGFDIDSAICESLLKAANGIGRAIAKRIGFRAWGDAPSGYSSIDWALELLDDGHPVLMPVGRDMLDWLVQRKVAALTGKKEDGEQPAVVRICNYKQLFRALMEEAERTREKEKVSRPNKARAGKKEAERTREKEKVSRPNKARAGKKEAHGGEGGMGKDSKDSQPDFFGMPFSG